MDMNSKLGRQILKATSDKTDLNKKILNLKKRFDEAGKMINTDKKKQKKQ